MTEILEYKILVLGPRCVGKTQLLVRFFSGKFIEDFDPTMEGEYRKTFTIDGIPAILDILETDAQQEFAALRDQWVRASEGFVLVYSITSHNSFNELDYFIQLITKIKEGELNKIAIVLAGNKCELDKHREISSETAQNLADLWKNTLGIKKTAFYEVSAKNNINTEEIFFKVVRLLRQIENEKKEQINISNESANKCCQIL